MSKIKSVEIEAVIESQENAERQLKKLKSKYKKNIYVKNALQSQQTSINFLTKAYAEVFKKNKT